MKKIISVFLAIVLVCSCVSCGKSTYNFGTDFQISTMQADGMATYVQSVDGVYTVQGTILRYFENGDTIAVPMCTKYECDHVDYGENTHKCDAYVGAYVVGAEYYNDALYIASYWSGMDSDNKEDRMRLAEYTLQGNFVRVVAELPDNVQEIIQHQGIFYYTSVSDVDKIWSLGYVTEDGEDSGVIYQSEDKNYWISSPAAYGKYLYYTVHRDSKSENIYHTEIYDTETGEIITLDSVQKVYFCNDKLVYGRLEDGAIYTANLNGGNEKKYIRLEYVNAIMYAYDDVVIASNIDERTLQEWTCEFALYKDGQFVRTFTVDDFSGGEWDEGSVTYNIFHTESYIYMTVLPENKSESVLLRFNREAFEKGVFEPVVMVLG